MFLLGNWKSYEELEEQLSIDELLATLNAYRNQKREEQKFLAALQGVDLSDDQPRDIASLQGYEAVQEGFGVGVGLGYTQVGVDQ